MKPHIHMPNGPYNKEQAANYNSIWWQHDHWKAEGDFHKKLISAYLMPDTKWLDVGCGTGYFLQNFPEADRTGLDISAAMLAEAAKANPGVQFVEQSLADNNPDLEGRFGLVTCTGQPWSYLPTLAEQEKVVENLAKWTADGGTCMLSQIDLSDLVKIDNLSYFFDESSVAPGSSFIRGAYWIHRDIHSNDHYCLSPNTDQWVRWFSAYFRRIEIVYGPHEPSYIPIPRRMLVCSEKRVSGDQTPVTLVGEVVPARVTAAQELAGRLTHRQLLSELVRRTKSGEFFAALKRRVFG